MAYPGIPISDKSLGAKSFDRIAGKMRNKLQPWKGKHISSGGETHLDKHLWGCLCCMRTITRRWTQSELSFFGEGLEINTNIT